MFRICYADPPWRYDDVRTGGSFTSGAAQVYDAPAGEDATMSVADLSAIPVLSIMDRNPILFLWTSVTLRDTHAIPVMRAWGFRRVASIFWLKMPIGGVPNPTTGKLPGHLGMGRWFRGDVEELLVCVAGDVRPFGCQERNWIQHPRTWTGDDGKPVKHSTKPEGFRRLIETATGEASSRRNLELFGRRRVPGWTVLGFEVDGLDIREAIRREAVRIFTKQQVGDAVGRLTGTGPV
jgi:N6-adenosine-specific RNA methylase IME4